MPADPIAFYRDLPAATSLTDIFTGDYFREVPSDWSVVITDVAGSTKAIEAGRYKEVNTAGGLAAIALANAFEDLQFPFVFGGDGVTFLIPGPLLQKAADVLVDTGEKVKSIYDLELRVGAVPISDLLKVDQPVSIARLSISPHYTQAIVQGGVDQAELWIKAPDSPYLLVHKKDPNTQADFTGFTCRWKDIPSDRGETISLIVKLRETDPERRKALYETLLTLIQETYGVESEHHPVKPDTLNTTSDPLVMGREASARSGQKGGFFFGLQMLRIRFELFFSNLAMKYKLPLKWGHYKLKDLKHYNIISCDFKKYDGTLKMVLAGASTHREKLRSAFQKLFEAGQIFYGLHVSDRALLTCILHSGSAQEVHFVDGADGGYALAAKMLKEQMRSG